jgi:hypothetical protein
MRKDLTSVPKEKFLAAALQLGMVLIPKKGWTKAYPPGHNKGKAIGIPNTEKVSRIEIVGFESKEVPTVMHPKPPAATVTQMLDFHQEEKDILEDFRELCNELKAMSAPTEEVVIAASDVGTVPAEALVQLEAAPPTEAPAPTGDLEIEDDEEDDLTDPDEVRLQDGTGDEAPIS